MLVEMLIHTNKNPQQSVPMLESTTGFAEEAFIVFDILNGAAEIHRIDTINGNIMTLNSLIKFDCMMNPRMVGEDAVVEHLSEQRPRLLDLTKTRRVSALRLHAQVSVVAFG